ncbi:MAG: hypothetical protein QOJ99_1596 [Bryobacterales bacterium]|nr:hypothetical protein [Bryobacterales bacterium]
MTRQPRTPRVLTLALLAVAPLSGQVAVRNQGYVPFSEEPIHYRSDNLSDPVARLQKQLDTGEATLDYDDRHGYLKSVLDKLHVPLSSQTLVFSKTSFQYKKISPETPRALYFNDDVYVGQVHDGKVIEFVSFDPTQGAIFYILDEKKAAKPVFQRAELDCTQCHVAAGTRGVPGVLLRSLTPTSTGTQASQTSSFTTSQQSAWRERFGGWYVTGTHGNQTHMGNLVRQGESDLIDISKRFDAASLLTPHSDIVAQLVQAHQTQTHNLITLTNYQTRIALFAEAARNKAAGKDAVTTPLSNTARQQYETPAEELVRNLLFANEAPLDGPVKGTSGYAEEVAARGPRDSHGRSLRDFDLNTRIFRYPCSYLIYSEAFDALPSVAKEYICRRLLDVLTGREQGPEYARLSTEDRRAVLEILLATKPDLRDFYQAASSNNQRTSNRQYTERNQK